jgi:hypothetical protein
MGPVVDAGAENLFRVRDRGEKLDLRELVVGLRPVRGLSGIGLAASMSRKLA